MALSFRLLSPRNIVNFSTKFFNSQHLIKRSIAQTNRLKSSSNSGADSEIEQELKKLSQVKDKSKADLLLEIEKEIGESQKFVWSSIAENDYALPDDFEGVSLQRGKTGVFDIEDLVELLRRENVSDICVIAVPRELQYVDYMVVTTGKSPKHLTAVAEFVRKIYKVRALPADPSFILEGKGNRDWVAVDLGNIALHLFSRSARRQYDLESLWTVGAKYDELCNQPEDAFTTLLKQHNFVPASSDASAGRSLQP